MATVYLALGSNVGDRTANINSAVALLGRKLTELRRAPLCESRAFGYTDQADFLNTAIKAQTTLDPGNLLAFVKQVECEVGRIKRFRWGPREIDIDIIFYDELVMHEPTLSIPHPRFAERDFVLRPLADLDGDMIDPLTGLTIRELLAAIPDDQHTVTASVAD